MIQFWALRLLVEDGLRAAVGFVLKRTGRCPKCARRIQKCWIPNGGQEVITASCPIGIVHYHVVSVPK